MNPADYYNKWYYKGDFACPTYITSVVDVKPDGEDLRVKLGNGVSYLESESASEIEGDGWMIYLPI